MDNRKEYLKKYNLDFYKKHYNVDKEWTEHYKERAKNYYEKNKRNKYYDIIVPILTKAKEEDWDIDQTFETLYNAIPMRKSYKKGE